MNRTYRRERLVLHGLIKGLVPPVTQLVEAWEVAPPACIALSVSPEELVGLRALTPAEIPELVLSDYEELYALGLGRFGEVVFPPPLYTLTLGFADEFGIRVEAIDLPEEAFSDRYVELISTNALLSHTLRKSLFKWFKTSGGSAGEFVDNWDARIHRISGFARLDEAREVHMVTRLQELADPEQPLAAVIEWERFPGVVVGLEGPDQGSGSLLGFRSDSVAARH